MGLLEEVRLFVQHLQGEPKTQVLAARPSLLPDLTLTGARILLADDDMRTVYALSALLREHGAANGRHLGEAAGLARAAAPVSASDALIGGAEDREKLRGKFYSERAQALEL